MTQNQESSPTADARLARGRLGEIAGAFLKLGLTSFGGPVAHLGYMRAEFVMKRKWLEDRAFGDIVALCQFLPGPASSQVVFALGMLRGGLLGAVTASICFMLPSVILMILFGYGMARLIDLPHAGWLHGLKLAAVAVVAQAVYGMLKNLCPDFTRSTMALATAALVLLFPGAYMQLAVIGGGAVLGWLIYRRAVLTPSPGPAILAKSHAAAVAALVLYGVLLFAPGAIAAATGRKEVAMFDSFYRSGALVFGGGHVVLPLLRAEVVPRGWISDDAFLAGYGAVQAMPGPLFTFSSYLGTVITGGPNAWAGGVLCLLAIFLPGWLLVGGALPFWHRLKAKRWMQAALRGANAAVVGILMAALYTPVMTESVRGVWDIVAAAAALGLLAVAKVPQWAVVALMAGAGQWVLR